MSDDAIGFLVPAAIIGACLWFAWLDDSKLRYEIQYDAEVTIADKPHDCDFLTAPLGRKNCSYRKEVSIVVWAQNASGKPIISHDGGETWYLNEGGPIDGVRVHVYWIRIND